VQQVEVSGYQGFFLGSAPTLDLMLGRSSRVTVRKFLPPHELDRSSAFSPRAALAVLVLGDSVFELIRVSEIVRAIGTAEDVCKEWFQHPSLLKKIPAREIVFATKQNHPLEPGDYNGDNTTTVFIQLERN